MLFVHPYFFKLWKFICTAQTANLKRLLSQQKHAVRIVNNRTL